MSFYGADLNNAFGSFEPPPQQQHVSTPIVKLQTILPPPPPPKMVVPPKNNMSTKRETIKIVTYALIILFALALYSVFEMIIKEICLGNDLSYKQEIAIRLVYPLLVFIVLWNIKMFIQ